MRCSTITRYLAAGVLFVGCGGSGNPGTMLTSDPFAGGGDPGPFAGVLGKTGPFAGAGDAGAFAGSGSPGPFSGGGLGGTGSACETFCNREKVLHCQAVAQPGDNGAGGSSGQTGSGSSVPTDCVSACKVVYAEFTQCSSLLDQFFNCASTAPLSCKANGDIDVAACPIDITSCALGGSGGSGGQGGQTGGRNPPSDDAGF